ncbi:type II secretion system protein GspK [soil metagenome]
MRHFKRSARQRGIALILVLWATTLLTVIASSFVFSTRTETLLAQNMVASARAQALADAAVQKAAFEIFRPENIKSRWKVDGSPNAWEYGGAKVNVVILDVSGKIDLNSAADLLLKGLFKSAGLDEERSAAMLDAVLDWRDPDDLKRLNGAEESEYVAAGLKYKPANAPFETVDELRRVLGMTPQLYAKLADSLTVESKQAGINTAIASKAVLLALPNVDEATVDAFLVLRQEALSANLPSPPFPQSAGLVAGALGSVYSVRAEATLPDGAIFIRETVVKINRGPGRKVAFLSWKDGQATPVTSGTSGVKIPNIADGK